MYANGIEKVEIELTTRCNASCPQCSRNYFGGKVWPTLPIVDLKLSVLKEKLSKSFLSTLKQIDLIGTYGDPCIHKDLIAIVTWIHESTDAKIVISTNGSLRSTDWWHKLGSTLRSQDRVLFGIDGLEDTNHLYRKGTNFKKIIANMTAFNNAGGKSIWSYVVFQHNEHQIDKAKKLSEELHCYGFAVKPTNRFVNKQHNLIENFPVVNKNGKTIYWLQPPTNTAYINPGYKKYKGLNEGPGDYNNYLKNTQIDCFGVKIKYVVISAEGYVFPCGWLQDRLYGYEAESHPDRQRLLDLIEKSGGFDSINIRYKSVTEILAGDFFKSIKDSWTNEYRLDRCANQCGAHNLFGASYNNIKELL
jgi:MoaA/NifB/PqqE/SkfB family radical SAM enzyme